jgi:hypothetical protein
MSGRIAHHPAHGTDISALRRRMVAVLGEESSQVVADAAVPPDQVDVVPLLQGNWWNDRENVDGLLARAVARHHVTAPTTTPSTTFHAADALAALLNDLVDEPLHGQLLEVASPRDPELVALSDGKIVGTFPQLVGRDPLVTGTTAHYFDGITATLVLVDLRTGATRRFRNIVAVAPTAGGRL